MTENMIERVATAMVDAFTNGNMQLDDAPEYHRARYLEAARATIETMREPTQAMVARGSWASYGGGEIGSTGSKNAWRKMIDAALSEDRQ